MRETRQRIKNFPRNSQDLQKALDEATPGTKISLLPIKYIGDFNFNSRPYVTLSGTKCFTSGNHTCLQGSRKGITLQASNCTIENLVIQGASIGIEVQGDKNTLNNLTIKGNTDGIIIEGNRNKILKSIVSDGEKGITIRGAGNKIRNCRSMKTSTYGIAVDSMSVDTEIRSSSAFSLELDEESSKSKVWNCVVNGGGAKIKGCGNEIKSLCGTGGLEICGDWSGLMISYDFSNLIAHAILSTFCFNASKKKVSFVIEDEFVRSAAEFICEL